MASISIMHQYVNTRSGKPYIAQIQTPEVKFIWNPNKI